MLILVGLLALGGAAGFVGSILGLGGGIVVVPGLSLYFDVPLRAAVAASLVAVVATSTGSAAVYMERGRVDLPLAIRLEVAAVVGAVAAGLYADRIPEGFIYFAFALAVLYAAAAMLRGAAGRAEDANAAERTADTRRRGWGALAMGGAGVGSALLGLGGGFAKVPVMHALMKVPLAVATATSVFMVGLTAAASAWIYWFRGALVMEVAVPVALGVLLGSGLGSRVSGAIPDRWLRIAFTAVLIYIAAEMSVEGYRAISE